MEHVTFTFGIAGVSRSLLAQITRHRIASFSVQSQRYVRKNQFTYVTPPAIAADEAAAALYHQTMEQTVQAYNALADRLQATYYPQFLAEGCTEKAARSKAEKKAIEDARYVLPNACETKMMVTMNVRSLRHFFQLQSGTVGNSGFGNADAETLLRSSSGIVPSCRSGLLSGRMSRGKDDLWTDGSRSGTVRSIARCTVHRRNEVSGCQTENYWS